MPNIKPTRQALMLAEALRKRGVEVELEHWDGHKHVDIFIPKAKLYIEIDGIRHLIDPKQFQADLTRDFYSNQDSFFTKHIPNEIIETHYEKIADSIALNIKD